MYRMYRIFPIILIVLNLSVVWGQEYQETTNSRGEIDPVALKNALEDIYARQEVDINDLDTFISSVATTYANRVNYLSNSSATVTYAPLAGNRSFAGVTTMATTNVTGFTALGTGNTAIKMKTIIGATGASEGDVTSVAHGVTGSKIAGFMSVVRFGVSSNSGVPAEYTKTAEFQYSLYYDATNFNLELSATNSGSILSKDFAVMIWYWE